MLGLGCLETIWISNRHDRLDALGNGYTNTCTCSSSADTLGMSSPFSFYYYFLFSSFLILFKICFFFSVFVLAFLYISCLFLSLLFFCCFVSIVNKDFIHLNKKHIVGVFFITTVITLFIRQRKKLKTVIFFITKQQKKTKNLFNILFLAQMKR